MEKVPHYVFRVDASLEIGTGHVMRCLTLADGLVANGGYCTFITRAHTGHLIPLIQRRGFDTLVLPDPGPSTQAHAISPSHAHWLRVHWAEDAQQVLDLLGGRRLDWLIVDHYALDVQWEKRMRIAFNRVMVIDDLADRHHDCDVLLDQNFGQDQNSYLSRVPEKCQLLVGSKFSLLRPDFYRLRSYSLRRRENLSLRKILITMGGVDKDNATGRILRILARFKMLEGIQVAIVMGPSAPWLEDVKEQATYMPFKTEVLAGVSNMAELMAESDLAIGAAGSTCWERCVLGLPTWMMILADNQKKVAKKLSEVGAAQIIPNTDFEMNEFFNRKFIGNSKKFDSDLRSLAIKSSRICEGLGTNMVVSKLEEFNG